MQETPQPWSRGTIIPWGAFCWHGLGPFQLSASTFLIWNAGWTDLSEADDTKVHLTRSFTEWFDEDKNDVTKNRTFVHEVWDSYQIYVTVSFFTYFLLYEFSGAKKYL